MSFVDVRIKEICTDRRNIHNKAKIPRCVIDGGSISRNDERVLEIHNTYAVLSRPIPNT